MKKLSLIICFTIFSFASFAQHVDAPATAFTAREAGIKSFTFGLVGLQNIGVNTDNHTGSLLFRYYVASDMAVRLGVNLSASNNKSELDSTNFTSSSSVKSNQFRINLGIEKTLTTTGRIAPYVGIDLFGGFGKTGIVESEATSTSGGSTFSYSDKTEPGTTVTVGLTPVLGFHWFLVDHLAIGAEFGWGLSIDNTGDGLQTTTSKGGGSTITTKTITPSSKSTSIGTTGSGNINVSVFF